MESDSIIMPNITLMGLFIIRTRFKNELLVHYELLPKYLRGIIRYFKIPKESVIRGIEKIYKIRLLKILYGSDVPGYPKLHLRTMELAAEIAEELSPGFKGKHALRAIEMLMGDTSAIAFCMKHIALFYIFSQILPILSCNKSLGGETQAVLAMSPELSADWIDVVGGKLDEPNITLFKWPGWYLRMNSLQGRISVLILMLYHAFYFLRNRGVSFSGPPKKHFRVITEFIDPRRMNGSAWDADYWIDGNVLTKKNVLFFLTHAQKRVLSREFDISEVVREIRERGYELADLDLLGYSPRRIRELLSVFFFVIRFIGGMDTVPLNSAFLSAFCGYLEYAPMFDRFHSDFLVFLTIPNGNTGLRYESGLITGLCRKNGIKSVGCQTRIIDGRHYEFCFEVFDLFFSWGPGWDDVLGRGMRFIDRTATIGCTSLDSLIPSNLANRESIKPNSGGCTRVLIFPTDMYMKQIGPLAGTFYSPGYVLSFLDACMSLAEEYPHVDFNLKTKDPQDVDVLLSHESFRERFESVSENFHFMSRSRCDYVDLIAGSDIVLAIAYTTPGIEALLLGRRVIYFSELEGLGSAFKLVPGLVAEGRSEFRSLFRKALQDHDTYARETVSQISLLDPHRDGRALARALFNMFGPEKC